MGLDRNAMARLKRRKIESGMESTELYQAVATMKEFNLSPEQWAKTTRLDKKIMMYHRAAESYHMDMAQTRAKESQKPPPAPAPRLKRGYR